MYINNRKGELKMNKKIKMFSILFLFLIFAPIISVTLFLGVAGVTLLLSMVMLAISLVKAILSTTIGVVFIAAIISYITTRRIQKKNVK